MIQPDTSPNHPDSSSSHPNSAGPQPVQPVVRSCNPPKSSRRSRSIRQKLSSVCYTWRSTLLNITVTVPQQNHRAVVLQRSTSISQQYNPSAPPRVRFETRRDNPIQNSSKKYQFHSLSRAGPYDISCIYQSPNTKPQKQFLPSRVHILAAIAKVLIGRPWIPQVPTELQSSKRQSPLFIDLCSTYPYCGLEAQISLMTDPPSSSGRYPFHRNLARNALQSGYNFFLEVNFVLLPANLK